MESSASIPPQASPLMLLTEGKDQVIKVDFKGLLSRVMSVVGASSAPVFKHIDCGEDGIKVAVNLDAKFQNHAHIPELEGTAFRSIADAEENAVMKVFSYLDHNCLVKLTDFSTRVAFDISLCKSNSNGIELCESLCQLLDQLDSAIQKSSEFLGQLQGDSKPFLGFREFLELLIKEYSAQASTLRSKVDSIGSELKMLSNVHAELNKDATEKAYFKEVHVSSKFLLQHVFIYLGLTIPKYSNGPDGDDFVEAVAQITVPYSKHRKFGGNIHIKAKGKSSTIAEENAAYRALSFMIQNFGVILVDINYCQRIEAQNQQSKLNGLIADLAAAGDSFKELWSSFMDRISHKIEELSLLANSVIAEPNGPELFAAYKHLVDVLEMIQQGAMHSFDSSWAMYDLMYELEQKLDAIKFD